MLKILQLESLEQLCQQVIPTDIRTQTETRLPAALNEIDALAELEEIGSRNCLNRSLIGMGWSETVMPAVIRRNILENPSWYTAYTPYQPEISQGRLTMLLNFQQLVMELTNMEIANASLLDEASAAAEAMLLCRRVNKTGQVFYIVEGVHPQTLAVLQTRARWLGIELEVGGVEQIPAEGVFGALLQYPATDGEVPDSKVFIDRCHAVDALAVVSADPLALALLRPPGDFGADVVIGSMQRFGVSMAAGGPSAAYIATRLRFSRSLPGRLVGVSNDASGRQALRLSLQTREQHIRRHKSTSNICTAQVLPAILATAYGLYHGAEGLCEIAANINRQACLLAEGLIERGYCLKHSHFFDTLHLLCDNAPELVTAAARRGYNLRLMGAGSICISLGEGIGDNELKELLTIFPPVARKGIQRNDKPYLPEAQHRSKPCLSHPVFSQLRSETDLMRYLRRLAQQDIALDRSMIPLGSCTMKLNSAVEMEPISSPAFAAVHPYAPLEQLKGYSRLVGELEEMLCQLTGFAAVSLQPNAGSQGEYAGLLAIRNFHAARGESERNICLIPASAHGTNPASAVLAGLEIVVVACDDDGDIDLQDVEEKAHQYRQRLAAMMVTYPSTHGVFEHRVRDLCDIIHRYGGQVYLDGANLNAMLGLVRPAELGFDVCHLNLHKTFCIPHGGGGPGMGPIAVAAHLKPWVPADPVDAAEKNADAVSASRWGSAGILPISWMFLRLMGTAGIRRCGEIAILNANYIARRLSPFYPVLYTGNNGFVAHECIFDLRPLKQQCGVTEEDIAKRLMDFGFHAPTTSFPVAGTLMVEPTESENLAELERFCEAMIAIRVEIDAIINGKISVDDSPLRHAPHTAEDLVGDWERQYTRAQAVYPAPWLKTDKYWPPVNRIDNVYGDRQLCCVWPSPSTER